METVVAKTRTPVEMLREVFTDQLNRRDAEALVQYWAEDIVEEFPTGTIRGRSAVRKYFADLFAAIPDFHIEALHIAGDGDTAFVRWHLTGTFSGAPWMGLEPTGSPLELNGIDCFTFRDGLVAQLRRVRPVRLRAADRDAPGEGLRDRPRADRRHERPHRDRAPPAQALARIIHVARSSAGCCEARKTDCHGGRNPTPAEKSLSSRWLHRNPRLILGSS
ncbi:MAG: nuclear transport factor 2 family protein [Deltaproteobacteria bacterium]|nr:nuclear transport factor 2 family protein [Deltaproteobacteria bacterium]